MINRIRQYDWKKYNFSLLCVVVILCILGLYCVRMAGGTTKGASLMKGQLVGLILGLIIVAIVSVIDYHFICQFCIVYYIAGILLTLAVHTPLGTDNKTGTYRWIELGPITFQPTELMKIILIITLAALFSKLHSKLDKGSTLVKVCVVSAIPVLAILTQPDLSSSLVGVFIMCVMIFIGGVSYRIIVPILIAAVPICGFLAWYVQIPGNLILHNYQYNRIQAWLHPDTYPNADNLNWQQNSAIKAIASGQLYGKFIQDGGKGLESRTFNGVGIRESDFIWSVVGEEFGFLGCCLVLLLFAIVIFKCFMVAKKAQDYLGKMIAVGVSAMFMFQVFANICVVTFIFPNTGLPLPFISNGLSSMISSMIGIGLVMNVGIQPAKSSKEGFTMRNLNPPEEDEIDEIGLDI